MPSYGYADRPTQTGCQTERACRLGFEQVGIIGMLVDPGFCKLTLRNDLEAFGPYLSGAANVPDYSLVECRNAERVCAQSIWLGQNLLLGSPADMDDIVAAFQKIYDDRTAL